MLRKQYVTQTLGQIALRNSNERLGYLASRGVKILCCKLEYWAAMKAARMEICGRQWAVVDIKRNRESGEW